MKHGGSDKSLGMAKSEGKRMGKMQGGTNYDQGPKGAGDVKTGQSIGSAYNGPIAPYKCGKKKGM